MHDIEGLEKILREAERQAERSKTVADAATILLFLIALAVIPIVIIFA